MRFVFVLLALFTGARVAFAGSEIFSLQVAIATCQVAKVSALLKAGANPNANDRQGQPVVEWLAANRKCDDDSALATAKLLDRYGAKFEVSGGHSSPSLLVQTAQRGLPKTLEFLCRKKGAGDPTHALRAIARRPGIELLRVLLAAGADPLAGVARSSALFDAASAGQVESVSEMLRYIDDIQSPKVKAAYEIAKKTQHEDIINLLVAAGFKAPSSVKPQADSCEPRDLSAAQVKLLSRLGLPNAGRLAGIAGPMACKFLKQCGDLILVDCNSAADGPAYYVNVRTEQIVATCGGACMRGCSSCPPRGWTCECAR